MLGNILYDNKTLNSIEPAHDYTAAILDVPQTKLATQIGEAHEEKVA